MPAPRILPAALLLATLHGAAFAADSAVATESQPEAGASSAAVLASAPLPLPTPASPTSPGATDTTATEPATATQSVAQTTSAPTTGPAPVSFDVRDADLATLMQSLADKAGANLIVSPKIKVQITCRLQKIDPLEAILLLAKANGLVVENTANVLMVLPDRTTPTKMKITVIPLQNADAAKVAQMIKALSRDGRTLVTHDERTNRLIVSTPE